MAVVAKRTVMTLYSDEQDIYSHQVRIVLAKKGVNVEIHPVNSGYDVPEELMTINPYGTVPTLVDRDLVLFKSRIVMEYLDERFPHPPLLPVYPVARAEARKMMYRIERDWYSLMHKIEDAIDEKDVASARRVLCDSLVGIAPIFADKPYFMSDEFSMMDCCIAPLLWRLPQLGISLPSAAKAITKYCERVFAIKAFQHSLTDTERELREAA